MTKGGRIAGGVLSIVGGSLLLLAGFLDIVNLLSIHSIVIIIRMIVTISCGALNLVGGILAVKDINAGGILGIVGGGIGSVGVFIPIGVIVVYMVTVPVYLIYTFIFIDPFLALAGGITATAVGSEL